MLESNEFDPRSRSLATGGNLDECVLNALPAGKGLTKEDIFRTFEPQVVTRQPRPDRVGKKGAVPVDFVEFRDKQGLLRYAINVDGYDGPKLPKSSFNSEPTARVIPVSVTAVEVWAALEADPEFQAGMERAGADFAAGRFEPVPPAPKEAPEPTASDRAAWKEALADPRFKAALDEGLGHVAQGITRPWKPRAVSVRGESEGAEPEPGLPS